MVAPAGLHRQLMPLVSLAIIPPLPPLTLTRFLLVIMNIIVVMMAKAVAMLVLMFVLNSPNQLMVEQAGPHQQYKPLPGIVLQVAHPLLSLMLILFLLAIIPAIW